MVNNIPLSEQLFLINHPEILEIKYPGNFISANKPAIQKIDGNSSLSSPVELSIAKPSGYNLIKTFIIIGSIAAVFLITVAVINNYEKNRYQEETGD